MSDQPKPTTGEATEKSHAVNQVRGMHEQIQQALKDARQTPEYAEKKSSEPTTSEWTHEKLQGLLQISNEDRYVTDHHFENTLDEINAALAAEKREIERCPKCGHRGCLDCDFHGTRSGYDQVQQMDKEAHESAPHAPSPQSTTTVCTCDNASGLHWGKCPLNMKPTTGEWTAGRVAIAGGWLPGDHYNHAAFGRIAKAINATLAAKEKECADVMDAHERKLNRELEKGYNRGRADGGIAYELAMRDNRKLDKELRIVRDESQRECFALQKEIQQLREQRDEAIRLLEYKEKELAAAQAVKK
jgi:hypothetical protein